MSWQCVYRTYDGDKVYIAKFRPRSFDSALLDTLKWRFSERVAGLKDVRTQLDLVFGDVLLPDQVVFVTLRPDDQDEMPTITSGQAGVPVSLQRDDALNTIPADLRAIVLHAATSRDLLLDAGFQTRAKSGETLSSSTSSLAPARSDGKSRARKEKKEKRSSASSSSSAAAAAASGPPLPNSLLGLSAWRDIFEDYDLKEVLGKGAYGVVRRGIALKSGLPVGKGKGVAVKSISKDDVAAGDQTLAREAKHQSSLNHPNIVKLLDQYEDENDVYLVLELVEGRELFETLEEDGAFSEKRAADVTRQIVSAIAYMHKQGLAHRDLKAENVLLYDTDKIKLNDLGFSQDFRTHEMQTMLGSTLYVAPEILTAHEDSYGPSVDMWACGVLTYILLCGFPPFFAESAIDMVRMIESADFNFDDPAWTQVSPLAKDFISKLLVVSSSARMTAEQALKHEWIAKSETLSRVPLALSRDRLSQSRKQLRETRVRHKKKK